MISQVNGATAHSAYTNSSSETKESSKKGLTNISKQGDMSKVEKIKASLESGEYKINIQALSEKIAEELL
jgi:anti-sigma28 factor (negative regulator of flagellin synthesis)